jgi:hypothetical protein
MTSGTNQWALKWMIYPPKTRWSADFPRMHYQYLDNAYRPYLITMVTNWPEKIRFSIITTRFTHDVKRRVTSASAHQVGSAGSMHMMMQRAK